MRIILIIIGRLLRKGEQTWKVETKFRVRLGGNTYINTPNLVVYKGTPIFRIRRSDDDGILGIDFDVFDSRGQRVATFAKGVVVQGDEANYKIETGHDVYSVTERSSGRVVARVQRRGVQGAELDVPPFTCIFQMVSCSMLGPKQPTWEASR